MKNRLLLALGIGFFLSFGTLFIDDVVFLGDIECQDGRNPLNSACTIDRVEERGFPLGFIEQDFTSTTADFKNTSPIGDESYDILAAFANWMSWSAVAFFGLIAFEWLAKVVSKFIVGALVGLVGAAYVVLLIWR